MAWTTFVDRLDAAGERPAIASAGRVWTAAELRRAADTLARGLLHAGVREGAVVAVSVENSFSLVAAVLALWRVAATVALVPPGYGTKERAEIESGVRPEAWLMSASAVASAGADLGAPHRIEHAPPLDVELRLIPRATRATSTAGALIKFSSGSTGMPKGILLTGENVMAEADNVVGTLGLGPGDRILAPVSLSHSYGFDLGVLGALFSGAALHIAPPFVPRRFLGEAAAAGITHVLGVPPLYRALVHGGEAWPDLRCVRYFLSCTARLPADVVIAFHDRFGQPICQHYGASEVGAATTHDPARVLDHPESVGRPMRGVDVRIVRSSGAPSAPGESGEVVVRSGAVARGYVMGAPKRSPFRDGAFHMGDVGWLNDGFLTIVGRLDNLINVGGLKVSPEEVVQVLERHPAVGEAAVSGAPTPSGEEVVYAAVTLLGPATEAELLGFCRRHLAEHKVPRRVELVDQLPRGPTGKIQLRPESGLPW